MSIARLEHFLYLEQLRATVLDALRTYGLTRMTVAEEAGVSPRILTLLLKGGDPHPKYLRAIDNWCERWGTLGVWPEQAALACTMADVPVDARLRERAAFATWLSERLTQHGHPAPDWISDELDDCRFLTRPRLPSAGEPDA